MSSSALIVVDMINAYDFPDAEKVVPSAREAVPVIKMLIEGADGPVIYVNDNFGHWRSNRDELVGKALDGKHPELVEPIAPDDDALFVVKARHSIFYQTPLEYLLNQEGVDRVVLTGQVTEHRAPSGGDPHTLVIDDAQTTIWFTVQSGQRVAKLAHREANARLHRLHLFGLHQRDPGDDDVAEALLEILEGRGEAEDRQQVVLAAAEHRHVIGGPCASIPVLGRRGDAGVPDQPAIRGIDAGGSPVGAVRGGRALRVVQAPLCSIPAQARLLLRSPVGVVPGRPAGIRAGARHRR